jgi:hypothetical protein
MDTSRVEFKDDEIKEMAVFLSQLIREGVTFKVDRLLDGTRIVELTGGF